MVMHMLTRIVDWLRQRPMVRIFVCVVSCVVGLLCYALSSSFHHLFGKWIWWEILLYTLLCFFVILVVFWLAKASHGSISTLSKALNAVLVLLITSVYSYFVDKKVNAKPDAYILFSYAAFAIMSLALSTLSDFGIEVELLNFFASLLILQLMKIKFLLVVLVIAGGVGFMYVLVNPRPTEDPTSRSGSPDLQEIVVDTLHPQSTRLPGSEVDSPQEVDASPENEDVPLLVSHVDSPQEVDSPLENEDVGALVSPVDSSQEVDVVPLENEDNRIEALDNSDSRRAQFMGCIEALKKENSNVINTVWKHVRKNRIDNLVHDENQIPWQRDDNLVVDSLPSGIIKDLCESADWMKTSFLCLEAYASWRREFLDMILLQFPSPNLMMKDIDNKEEIKRWLETFTVAVTILLPNERTLCDRVFGSFVRRYDWLEAPITKVWKDLGSSLLSTCYALATWSRDIPPQLEKLMHNMFEDPLPFESLADNATSVPRILGYFKHLKSLIDHDAAQATIDGGIHSITREVMGYIRETFIQEYGSLGRCFEEYAMAAKQGKLSPSPHLARIIELLERCLETTSTNHRTSSLGYLFIVNNRRFIAHEAELLGLEHIIDFDWLRANKHKIEENLQLYLRSSWGKILNFLKLDFNSDDFNSDRADAVTELMLDELRSFNEHMDDICNDQAMWFVFDDKLKNQIIKSIENMLLPAYGKIIERLEKLLRKDAYNHIKLGMYDIQSGLKNLFVCGASRGIELKWWKRVHLVGWKRRWKGKERKGNI